MNGWMREKVFMRTNGVVYKSNDSRENSRHVPWCLTSNKALLGRKFKSREPALRKSAISTTRVDGVAGDSDLGNTLKRRHWPCKSLRHMCIVETSHFSECDHRPTLDGTIRRGSDEEGLSGIHWHVLYRLRMCLYCRYYIMSSNIKDDEMTTLTSAEKKLEARGVDERGNASRWRRLVLWNHKRRNNWFLRCNQSIKDKHMLSSSSFTSSSNDRTGREESQVWCLLQWRRQTQIRIYWFLRCIKSPHLKMSRNCHWGKLVAVMRESNTRWFWILFRLIHTQRRLSHVEMP